MTSEARRATRFPLAAMVLALLLGLGSPSANADPAPDGASVYQAHCARCHGEDGRTDTPNGRTLKVRPLVADPQLARMSPQELVNAIRSSPKHQGVVDLSDLRQAELEVTAFVRALATQHD